MSENKPSWCVEASILRLFVTMVDLQQLCQNHSKVQRLGSLRRSINKKACRGALMNSLFLDSPVVNLAHGHQHFTY
jgi:hypothetical protein